MAKLKRRVASPPATVDVHPRYAEHDGHHLALAARVIARRFGLPSHIAGLVAALHFGSPA